MLSWAGDCEQSGALTQAVAVSAVDGVVAPVVLMPDAHAGRGVCVGAVIAADGRIVPAAAGVDLGCGMSAVRLAVSASQLPDDLSGVLDAFAAAVPARKHDRRAAPRSGRAAALRWLETNPPPAGVDAGTAAGQLGTLGGGNHFVELSVGSGGGVWVVLHSGSRGAGRAVAVRHIAAAQRADPGAGRDLGALVEGTAEFGECVAGMVWAQAYALANRTAIGSAAVNAVAEACRLPVSLAAVTQRVSCHHNYAQVETHHGRRLWITRKGAISARAGEWGIVPGSMGASTFLVRGLGCEQSWQSAAHGAGRRLSRCAARASLDVGVFEEAMSATVWRRSHAKRLLDEAPDAHKPIGEVMAAQRDLCTPVDELAAVVNYKGL